MGTESPRISRGWYFSIGKYRFGAEYSPVYLTQSGELYLQRWIAYFGLFNLRLHKFHRGDDERAPHDHPFWFITFPFSSYTELVDDPYSSLYVLRQQVVKAFRFHFRPATYRHIVLQPERPFWTFVIAGNYSRSWGFWQYVQWDRNLWAYKFMPWREWK